jgi:hypothetical protein
MPWIRGKERMVPISGSYNEEMAAGFVAENAAGAGAHILLTLGIETLEKEGTKNEH